MEVRQAKLQNLLAGVVQYRVPLFQRTYNWERTQWAQLWDDVLALYGAGESRTHFVGSVVTQPMPGAAGGAAKYALIDGQQRMTTLMALLCAIRDRARREADTWGNLPDAIQKMYLINEFADAPGEINKLAPTARDAAPFRAMIDGEATSGETRIGSARRYFSDALSKSDANGNPLDLRKLANCVAARLDIVSITLNPNDNPNRIFESLNYTGLSLNAFDLIRNYVFMNIRDPRKQDDAYEKHWLPMQEELGRENPERQTMFFWRYLAKDGDLPKRERGVIFDGVRDLIGPDADDDAIVNALKEFHEFSDYYMEVVDPFKHGTSEAISERIIRIFWWGAANAANTFLMKAISHVHRGDIREDELAKVIDMIESFLVRRHMRGYTQAGLRDIFARILRRARFAENEFAGSALNVLRNYYWPNDHNFVQGFLRRPLYVHSARYPRARLILNRLEREHPRKSKEAPDPNGEKISIEHIMPQNLTREWQDALGPNSVGIHSRLLHTLGNLTLTGYNPEMSDKPFHEKKTWLAESNFALNSSLKELDEWNAETIQRRGRELAELAAKIWRVRRKQ